MQSLAKLKSDKRGNVVTSMRTSRLVGPQHTVIRPRGSQPSVAKQILYCVLYSAALALAVQLDLPPLPVRCRALIVPVVVQHQHPLLIAADLRLVVLVKERLRFS